MRDTIAAAFGIPAYIRRLERFGVGSFDTLEPEKKSARIRAIMERRKPIHHVPIFSVIVPMHKETRYLLATLRSLAEQKNENVEFIIISNGEPIGNPTMRLAEASGFRVIHERKPGVGRARQIGLEAARGQIIVTTDGDTLQPKKWLDAIEAEWEAVPNLVGGFGRVYALSDSVFYHFCAQVQNVSRSVLGTNFFFCAAEANTWFLREAALQVGGYNTNITYAEGAMLMRKLAEIGEIRRSEAEDAAVYTSDRRDMTERIKAVTQFLITANPKEVRYEVMR